MYTCVCVYTAAEYTNILHRWETLRLLGRPQNKRKFTLYGYYFTSRYIQSKNMQYNVHWVYYYYNFVTSVVYVHIHIHYDLLCTNFVYTLSSMLINLYYYTVYTCTCSLVTRLSFCSAGRNLDLQHVRAHGGKVWKHLHSFLLLEEFGKHTMMCKSSSEIRLCH